MYRHTYYTNIYVPDVSTVCVYVMCRCISNQKSHHAKKDPSRTSAKNTLFPAAQCVARNWDLTWDVP